MNRFFQSLPILGGESLSQVERSIRLQLLPTLGDQVPASQVDRLAALGTTVFSWDGLPPIPDMLFAPTIAYGLGSRTCLVEDGTSEDNDPATAFLFQMLPIWACCEAGSPNLHDWAQASLGKYRVYTLSAGVWSKLEAAMQRMSTSRNAQAAVFARSASYMGSKAALSPQLCEIVHEFDSPDTVVFDLMCGSGAMSGAFSKRWETSASDAQEFSRLLARVQSGGMTKSRATALADTVLDSARSRFEAMPPSLEEDVAKEDAFIHRELTPTVMEDLVRWLERFDEVHSEAERTAESLTSARDEWHLFTTLYANLFFGVRQAYEIDCLRFGVDTLADAKEREWALGALICAVSQCAFSYGGHFAQPKLDVARAENVRAMAEEMLQKRSLSVSHEFYSRLISLAIESESTANEVKLVAGPWQRALDELQASIADRPVCVYLDPPYTRDEYSRYYHLLETMVCYQSGPVSGKGRLPQRGSPNRFASTFNSRSQALVEDEIASIIRACLSRGWSCLWSYSSSGMVSMTNTLAKVGAELRSVELFSMDHTYKIQGKHKPKHVTEYAMHLHG